MEIERRRPNERMSQSVAYGDTVYLSGQVARNTPGKPAAAQTADILAIIDELLAEAGSDKSKVLSALIWLHDIREFNNINEVWNAWIDPANPPARTCVESTLANPLFNVEITITAAR
jgi:enamine deaminase RidA (YjgF/YER057c/UK114 family)